MSGTRTITIPYSPQSYQLEIHDSPKRFKVVKIGRRGGKTELLINDTIKKSMQFPSIEWPHWIIGPSYRQVKSIIWTRMKALLRVDSDWIFNEQELSATHPIAGTKIELKGADNEESLRGVGLSSVGLDEFASFKANVWPEIIRPMLADRRAPALFIGTPKGRNHFFDLYNKQDQDWQSWGYPTAINKYIAPDEIEQARKDMSERLFKQEFLAEFLDDETGVFKRVRICIAGELEAPIQGRFYVMGVDLAKTEDFTVLTVIDSITRRVVAFERFQDVMWREQKLKIQFLARKYNHAMCVVDSTGLGDPIQEDLQHSGVSTEAFKFTNESKMQLIEQLAIAIEQRQITFPNIEILVDELMNYEYTITDQGRIKYGAPAGKHDDCVISLGLAVWGIRHQLHEAQVVQDQYEVAWGEDKQGKGTKVALEDADYQGAVSGY